ncbi:hypothetical protein V8F20_006489 [Naviculisporaceae sp. PSN 640]
MAPHPSQPGLEVNDSPGLEVVYVSNDVKPRLEDHASGGYYHHQEQARDAPGYGYRQTNLDNVSPQSRVSPMDYPQSSSYYDGTDKEVSPYGSPNEKRRKMILGLPVWLFWLIIVLIAAGAIGGGVGGSLAVKNAELNAQRATAAAADSTSPTAPIISLPTSARQNPTLTTSYPPTTTSSLSASTATPSRNPSVPFDGGCPRVNNTRFTPVSSSGAGYSIPDAGLESQTFLRLCNTNYPSGAEYGNPGIADIFKTWAATLDECMALCAAYNAEFNKTGSNKFNMEKGFCRSVAIVEREGEFCYLKNGTGGNNTMGAPNDFASAILIDELIVS